METTKNLELPLMLWNLLNLDDSELISWGPKGDTIILTKNAWNTYLANPVFDLNYGDWDEFSNQLLNYGFDLLNCRKDQHKGVLVHMKHKFFRRNRFDLLSKVICNTKSKTSVINPPKISEGKTGVISRDKLEQLRVFAAIRFNSLKRGLEITNTSSTAENSLGCKPTVIEHPSEVKTDDEPMIEFLTDCAPTYAGYYGEYTIEQLNQFFGDYLPKYGPNRKIIIKPFKKEFQTLLDNARNNMGRPKIARKFCKEQVGTQNYIPLSSSDEGTFMERTNALHEITKPRYQRKLLKEKIGTQNHIPISSPDEGNFIERTSVFFNTAKRTEDFSDYEFSDDEDEMGNEMLSDSKMNEDDDCEPSSSKKMKFSEPDEAEYYDFLEMIDANSTLLEDVPVPQYVQEFLDKAAEEKYEKEDMRKDFSDGIKDLIEIRK
ncbi:uncharacterized protein LOC119681223 [Teleopsis dalmanni]|uniref:uncharacterized protein LOC119681223 n=1 Tax=Teleopsis dalmanni TaxID=139649 RepID=UPI0018CD99FA|nr:uncharacterized protein LOC119681223 [Teleopsis dalmanni]